MTMPALPRIEHCLFQYSNIEAFQSRDYDGTLTIAGLRQYGNFGLGCFNALDGELICFEDKLYHATSDGKVCEASNDSLLSGAYSCFFEPQFRFQVVEKITFANCHDVVTRQCKIERQPFYAIRLDGHFSRIHVRSVPAQTQPYPSLDEVIEKQKIFNSEDLSATMVGFYFPSSMGDLAFEGLHLHFVSDDGSCGGHVLDFEMTNGSYFVDRLQSFFHVLPDCVRNQSVVTSVST